MAYILVEWIGQDPKQFSVCRKADIVDGELRGEDNSLIGRCVGIQWKRREYQGRILKIGTEEALENKADALATEEHLKVVTPVKVGRGGGRASSERTGCSRKRRRRCGSLSNPEEQSTFEPSNSNVLVVVNAEAGAAFEDERETAGAGSGSTEDKSADTDSGDTNYKEKYERLKEKYKGLKARYRTLKSEVDSDEIVELSAGAGLRMKKSELERRKMVSNHVTVLARNLFRFFFSSEELALHSLFGKTCNANKTTNPPLPSIDAIKRDGIINFILKDAGLEAANTNLDKEKILRRKALKREICKTLSDFLREEHRKYVKV